MSGAPIPPQRVPTLTEVVAWPQPVASAEAPRVSLPGAAGRAEADLAAAPQPLRPVDERVVRGVLVEVQRQVDLMLDYRLREVLTPLLNRAADSIVREARIELASTLRDVVAVAVAQELARLRTP